MAVAALALLAGWEAWGYRVAFVTDAAGPRALPLLAVGLLLAGALALALRPARTTGGGTSQAGGILRPLGAALLLGAVPVLISWLGFMITAAGAMAGLAMILGAPRSGAIVAGSVTAVGLYLLFVYGLGVPLPVGSLFLAPAPGGG